MKLLYSLRQHLVFLLLITIATYLMVKGLGFNQYGGDESTTAIYARNILKFGVPTAWDGQNLLAAGNGSELNENLINAHIPWLHYYLVAGSFWFFGDNVIAGRLPSILFALATIALVYLSILRLTQDKLIANLCTLIISLSPSFLLYARYCRYNALVMLLAMLIFYIISFSNLSSKKRIFWLSVLVALLFYANYLIAACLIVAGFLIFFIFYFDEKKMEQYLLASVLGFLAFLPWLIILNPFNLGLLGSAAYWDRKAITYFETFYYYLRLFNSENLFPVVLLIIFLIYFFREKQQDFKKCCLALFAFCLCYTFLITSLTGSTLTSRYLSVLIPFLAIISPIILVRGLQKRILWIPVALLLIFTDFLSLPLLLKSGSGIFAISKNVAAGNRFPLAGYLYETHRDFPRSVDVAKDLLRKHTKKDDVLAVINPDFAYHLFDDFADSLKFCCQLEMGSHLDLEKLKQELPSYVFTDETVPDWILVFGLHWKPLPEYLKQWEDLGIKYKLIDKSDVFWFQGGHPELLAHIFYPVTSHDSNRYGVYLLKKETGKNKNEKK
ncbi:MAG: glycosyltransferase family 39 protein [Pseudomonadota bacterium]